MLGNIIIISKIIKISYIRDVLRFIWVNYSRFNLAELKSTIFGFAFFDVHLFIDVLNKIQQSNYLDEFLYIKIDVLINWYTDRGTLALKKPPFMGLLLQQQVL